MAHEGPAQIAVPDATTPPGERDFAFAIAVLLAGAFVLLSGAYALIPSVDVTMRAVVDGVALSAGPLVCAFVALRAAQASDHEFRNFWLALGAGALFALVSQLISSAGVYSPRFTEVAPVGAVLFVIFELHLAVATALALRLRERGLIAEIVLDASLIILAAAVVVLRFSPAAPETTLRTPAVLAQQLATLLATIAGPLSALCATTFAALLLFWRGSAMSQPVAIGVLGGALCFVLQEVMYVLGGEVAVGDAASADELLRFGGWLFLSYAGIVAVRSRAHTPPMLQPTRFAARMRQSVVPASIFFICIAWIDAALNPPGRVDVHIAIAFMALLVMIRVTQLVQTAEHEIMQRQELAHTRALVEVSQALSGAKELRHTLDLVTRWAARLLDARTASIEMLAEDGSTVQLRTGSGQSPGDEPVSTATVPLTYRGRTLGSLTCSGDRPFTEQEVELLGALADQAALAIENARLFEQVTTMSMTDPLTGLANRRQLDRDLAREFAAAQRGRKLVCVIFDVDKFKEFNDTHGHLAGDEALRLFALALTSETRAMNLAARYGGDEFIVLLADSDRAGADIFVSRVRKRFPPPGSLPAQGGLSVAAGIAEYNPDMTSPEELVAEADLALYEDKARARRL